jgi:hypothetical protein
MKGHDDISRSLKPEMETLIYHNKKCLEFTLHGPSDRLSWLPSWYHWAILYKETEYNIQLS